MNLDRTKLLIYLTLFFTPLYLVKLDFLGIPLNVLELLIYATFLSWIWNQRNISHTSYKSYRSYESHKPYLLYLIGFFLIFSGLIISTFVNQNYHTGFGIIKSWFLAPFLFSIVLLNVIKNKKDIENILRVIYYSVFSVSAIALLYYFIGIITYDGRLAAFYGSPNYLAMFLAPGIFIGIYLIQPHIADYKLKNSESQLLIFYIIIFLIIGTTLYLTKSYATWLSIILSFLVILAWQKIKYPKKLRWVMYVILILFIVSLTQINNPKFQSVLNSRSSLASRLMIWNASFKMLENNTLWGIGPGNFQNTYLDYQKYFPPYLEWAVPQPHNLCLAFWLESGLIGFLGFLWLIIFWLIKLSPKLKQKNSLLAAALLGIIIYILLHGLVDTPIWKNDLALIFSTILSLGIATTNLQIRYKSTNIF